MHNLHNCNKDIYHSMQVWNIKIFIIRLKSFTNV